MPEKKQKKVRIPCSGCGGGRFGADGACVQCGRMKTTPGGQKLIDKAKERAGRPKPK